MKKFIPLILSCLVLLSLLVACGPQETKQEADQATEAPAADKEAEPADEAAQEAAKTDPDATEEAADQAAEADKAESGDEDKADAEKEDKADSEEEDKAQADPKEQKKITIMLDWQPNTNHTGLFVAQEKGFFEEAGLEVEVHQAPEDSAAPLVASGEAQFGVDFQDLLAAAWAKEEPLPVTAVATIIQHNTSGIISLEETGIKTFGDLAGHSYATWNTPVELAMMEHLVEKDGGDWDKVELIPSTVTDVVAALKTNVDSVWIYYGWDGISTEKAGLKTNFLRFSDADPVFDYYTPVLIANNDFLEEEPETAKKALEAISKGYSYAAENPEEAAEILLKQAPELDEEMVVASQEYLSQEYIADADAWGQIDQDRWDAFFRWLFEEDLIEQEIPEGFGFTNDFLPQ